MAAKASARKPVPSHVDVEDSALAQAEVESPELEAFTWKPADGGAAIELPNAVDAVPKGKALWFWYQLNKRSNDFVAQITFVMSAAGVPEALVDRVFELPDDELRDLVTAWTGALTGASVGES